MVLYSGCHYQLEVGRNRTCGHRAWISMYETYFAEMSCSGITFCGKAFFPRAAGILQQYWSWPKQPRQPLPRA